MLQQGLDVGEVSRVRGQGIQAVNYISVYSALSAGLASQKNSARNPRKELKSNCAWEYKEWVHFKGEILAFAASLAVLFSRSSSHFLGGLVQNIKNID